MSQHDYNIANQSFPSFRTDLNNALGAINTSNSGTSRPSGAVAGTIWLDTSGGVTAHILKFYDGGADINLATINTTANTVDFTDSTVTFDIVNDTSPQLGGDLDTNGSNVKVDDAHGIFDESNNEQLIFQTTSSAVNYAELTNAATSNDVGFSATGSDTNVGMSFTAKGSGKFKFNDSAYFPEVALTDASTIGGFYSIQVIQDGTGSRTLSFNAVYEFAGDVAPTLTTTAAKGDLFVFRYNGAKFLEVGRNLNLTLS